MRTLLLAALLAASASSALAQSALDAVAFIVKGQDKSGVDFQGHTKYRFDAASDKLVVTDLSWIGGAQVYTYTQENACRFHLVGAPTNNGFNKYDLTVDFSKALPNRPRWRHEQNPLNANGSTLILTVPGVRICRAKGSSGLMWSDVDQGQCLDELTVDVLTPQTAARTIVAFKYLQGNFCKGSAS